MALRLWDLRFVLLRRVSNRFEYPINPNLPVFEQIYPMQVTDDPKKVQIHDGLCLISLAAAYLYRDACRIMEINSPGR